MSDTMGHIPGNDPMHECGNCGSTYTGVWATVYKLGWRKHTQNRTDFIMCDDCEQAFAERRKQRELVEG